MGDPLVLGLNSVNCCQIGRISGSVKLHIGDSWGRKVTMHKCPRINDLNVETEPRMGDGEN